MQTPGLVEERLVAAVRRVVMLSMRALGAVDDATVRAASARSAVRAKVLPRGRLDEA